MTTTLPADASPSPKHYLRPFRVPSSPRAPSRSPRRRPQDLPASKHASYAVSAPSPPNPTHTHTALYWLALYFFFNLSLTLYNKSVLVRFPFPYSLTALHAFCSAIGSYVLRRRGYFRPAKTSPRQKLLLVLFSVLYTVNIAVSNISLQMVTIPFHQVVRSTTPLFTLLLSVSFLRSKFSLGKLISLIPVVAGVALATYGDYQFTTAGLLLTFLGTVLASAKTIATNLLQSSPARATHSHALAQPVTSPTRRQPSLSLVDFQLTTKLHPLDLLLRMSPLAFAQCIAYAYMSGELDRLRSSTSSFEWSRERILVLAMNGFIAFGLNVVSFTANKKTSALTMTVAANIKQVLTILLAVSIFNLTLSPPNAIGIVLTLVGGGWYGLVEYREKQTDSRLPSISTSTSTSWNILDTLNQTRSVIKDLLNGLQSRWATGRVNVGGVRLTLKRDTR